MEHAIRRHIKVNLNKDPALYKRFLKRMEEIIERYQGNWDAIVEEFEKVREDLAKGRKGENEEEGLDEQELPFYDFVIFSAFKDEAITDEKKRKVIMGAFDFVDVAKERESEGLDDSNSELSVIEWLREARLGNPFKLKSAYSAKGPTGREDLPFTNVTKEFVGCLDYIYFEESHFAQLCKLDVPTSFRDMNSSGISNGHLIPSDIWPSDHVAVGARLRMNQRNGSIGTRKPDAIKASEANGVDSKNATNNNNSNLPPKHDPKCACGCVPNILSLFEMAELRKKMREQKKAEAAALRAANLSK